MLPCTLPRDIYILAITHMMSHCYDYNKLESMCIHGIISFSLFLQLLGHESLVIIMAYDYQQLKFVLKLPKGAGAEGISSLVLRVGAAIEKHRVKFNATLARMRVKYSVKSITKLLPEASYRKYQSVMSQPFYARINRNKVTNFPNNIVYPLQKNGFTPCVNLDKLVETEKGFFHFQRNLIAFAPGSRDTILEDQLITEGYLVPQVHKEWEYPVTLLDIIIILVQYYLE